MTPMPMTAAPVRLGLRANAASFALLVLVNAFVGAVVGAERSVLPLLAEGEFGLASTTAALSFLLAFGLSKAVANYLAGDLADRVGRRRILLAGWLLGVPVPPLLLWAPSWGWVVFANLLLGVNQGLAWSATVIMKIDLVGPRRRGLAMGLNEFAGYVAVAAAAVAAGYLAALFGPRIALFGVAGSAVLLGLATTLLFVRDTGEHVALEQEMAEAAARGDGGMSSGGRISKGEGPEGEPSGIRRALLAANQAGFVNNLNDGMAWGLFPLLFVAAGLSLGQIGWLAALYPAAWGLTQAGTGALSDRLGRRPLIVAGMALQSAGLGGFALGGSFGAWAAASVVLGLGTAAVYPALIAQVSDIVPPADRARGVGVYRLWRDLGYVAGGLMAGLLADLLGMRAAIVAVAALTAGSGVVAGWLLPRSAPDHPSSPDPGSDRVSVLRPRAFAHPSDRSA